MNTLERAEQYCRKNQALFERWKQKPPCNGIDHPGNVFIRDGVVCPEKWFSQEVRPLFLLKEAYESTGNREDWDLAAYIQSIVEENQAGKHKTWNRVNQWAQGLFHSSAHQIYPYSLAGNGFQQSGKALEKIAVMNVRKSGGVKSSDMDTIRKYAKADQKELLEQLELIDPTLVVCGFTISCLNIILGKKVKDYAHRETFSTDLFYVSELNGHLLLVLDYWHPSNHFPDIMNYYGLIGSYQQALKALQ